MFHILDSVIRFMIDVQIVRRNISILIRPILYICNDCVNPSLFIMIQPTASQLLLFLFRCEIDKCEHATVLKS